MAGRRLRPLTPADLALLNPDEGCADLLQADASWARAAQGRWGFCGIVAGPLEAPRGWVLIAPSTSLPESHPMASRSRTPGAAVLLAVHVDEGRAACVRQLVQGLAGRLVGRASCLEALAAPGSTRMLPRRRSGAAHRRGGPPGAVSSCQQPRLEWLVQAGFCDVTDEDHRRLGQPPRMRLDLRRTVVSRAVRVLRTVADRAWVPVAPEPSRRGVGTAGRTR